jgi:hypothetical protein
MAPRIKMSDETETALRRVWAEVSPDAIPCSWDEAAELTLDRVGGDAGREIDKLIARHGYNAVCKVTVAALGGP